MRSKIIQSVMVIFLFLAGFSGASAKEADRPIILTTTTDLADITRRITGDKAVVTSIASGKEDPHFITARPGFIVQAREADVWIRIGMELEVGWEDPILRDSRNRKIQEGAGGHIDVSEQVLKLDVPKERVTRDMGDVHPAGNPHYWLDPLNGRIMAQTIADRLSDLYPRHRNVFQGNLQAFRDALDFRMFGESLAGRYGGARLWKLLLEGALMKTLDADGCLHELGGWYGMLVPYRGRSIVTYHRSWVYLAERFHLKPPMELEPKPGIPPSSRHLARVMETVTREKVRVILQEPFYSRKAADFISEKTGATVLILPNTVNGTAEARSYLELIDLVVRALSGALEIE